MTNLLDDIIEPEHLLPILQELKEKRPEFYKEWAAQTLKVADAIKINDNDSKKTS